MLRLAWPAYTNEAIFLFHATTLVFFSGFPAFAQKGDALYYANYFADKTFNPFIPYPIVAFYFILQSAPCVPSRVGPKRSGTRQAHTRPASARSS
jgi:polar amino acid transport system permease protein